VPINAEMAAGVLVPVVLWGVWRTTQKIHARLHEPHGSPMKRKNDT